MENKAGGRGDWDVPGAHGSCPKAGGRRTDLRAPMKLETALRVVRNLLVWSEPIPSSLVAMVMVGPAACSEADDLATCTSGNGRDP